MRYISCKVHELAKVWRQPRGVSRSGKECGEAWSGLNADAYTEAAEVLRLGTEGHFCLLQQASVRRHRGRDQVLPKLYAIQLKGKVGRGRTT